MIAALPFYNKLFDQGLLIGSIIFILVVILQIKRITFAVLQGQSRVGRSGIVGLVDSSMQALAQSLFVFFGAGLVGLAGGAVVGTAIAATVGVVLIDQSISVAWPNKEDILSVASFTKYNFLSGVATKFYDNIDILTIKYFLDDSAVGVYGIGFRFALPIQIFSGAISDVTMPEISKEAADNNTERVTELISDSIIFAIIIALPAVVGVAVLAEELVITAFSSSFIDSTNIAIVGVAIQIPASLRSVFNSALNAADYPDVSARAGFLVVVINFILDILLVPLIGPLGAIFASLVAIGTATTYLGYRVFSIFSLSITDLPLHELAVEIAAALFMGGVVYGITIIFSLPNFYLLVFTIPTGALVYFTTLFIFSASIRGRILAIANDILPIDLQI
jgi:O-antigen/teichoic acid export membrane protein